MDKQTWTDWQWQQSQAFREIQHLQKEIKWLENDLTEVSRSFQFQVTPYYLSLIDKNNPEDPLARLIFPSIKEAIWKDEEMQDPIGDRAFRNEQPLNPTPAIVHRYPDRCLLFLTPLCSSYCRYCFRREIVSKPQNNFTSQDIEEALEYIKKTPVLKEVILTGGDPLVWGDQKLMSLLKRIDQIPHVRMIRLHTRFPVFNPFRITPEFVEGLESLSKPVSIIVHVMHYREITAEFKQAMLRLYKAGVMLLNQSVLVKGCNDSVDVLRELSYSLLESKIKPQYLHLMDLARGTSHFRLPLSEAQNLLLQLRGTCPGYLIPQLMLDIPGGYGKVPVELSSIKKVEVLKGENLYHIRSPLLPDQPIVYKDV